MRRAPRLERTIRQASTALIFACGLVVLTSACARRPMLQAEIPADALDFRVMRHTYLEEGALVALGVSADATRRREKSPLVPVGIVLANNGVPLLTINRESLTLVDDNGRRYPMVTIQEFKSMSSRAMVDIQASRQFAEIFAGRFQALNRVPSVFFPIQVSQTRGMVSDEIELPRQHWMIDVIYFPHPEGELLGRRYELWFAPPELDDPVFVRFAVD